ncbi:uncharacterized protein LOC124276091 [Haliotis rubra]|uniref:uncharacterized protein LOC124276091 n=1 Tax=Haliotis rubra TaxID=36100 RepID=UPI001EE5E8AF|nr:uncharacterized protein LOC124276091 [Haliotis rubra]
MTVNRVEIRALEENEELRTLDRLVRHSMNLDFPERLMDDKRHPSYEDKKFLTKVEESIRLESGHYTIALPLRREITQLPSNHSQAFKRLMNLKHKMERNSNFLKDYRDFMDKIVAKGYAERVPDHELERDDGRVWFIPHHGVYHPHKPNKIRVVFDCTAMHQGVSLNSLLLQGPDLTNRLIAVLLRFRQEPVAVMGDIESMFYQVQVPKEDWDLLRFYWWEKGDLSTEPIVYRMCVHLFGAVSSPSCATAALRQTAKDNRSTFTLRVTEVVNKSFYVDDCLKSVENENKAMELIDDVSALCAKGGFHVTKWVSNSPTVIHSIPVNERAGSVKALDLKNEELPEERALGVLWSVQKDCFKFDIQVKAKSPTRRGILSIVSSVYDPLGYASPYVLVAKILLQQLCKENLGWDQEISYRDQKTWQQWIDGLSKLKKH